MKRLKIWRAGGVGGHANQSPVPNIVTSPTLRQPFRHFKCETKMTSSAHPEQPQLFLFCNGFSSSLTTYVLDKHLRLQKSTNFSMLVAIQHIIQSYVTVFFKDDISRRQKSATRSLLRSSTKRFILSGQPMTNKLNNFYSIESRHSTYIPEDLYIFLLIVQ